MMKLNPTTYIPALEARLNQLARRTRDYKLYLKRLDELNIIRHDFSEGLDVNKAMHALNKKLCTAETKFQRGRNFIKSAQSAARYTRPAAR